MIKRIKFQVVFFFFLVLIKDYAHTPLNGLQSYWVSMCFELLGLGQPNFLQEEKESNLTIQKCYAVESWDLHEQKPHGAVSGKLSKTKWKS